MHHIPPFILQKVFPALVARNGLAATFGLHLAVCVTSFLFVYTCLAETKGKSPEAIRRELEARLCAPRSRRALSCCPDPDGDDECAEIPNCHNSSENAAVQLGAETDRQKHLQRLGTASVAATAAAVVVKVVRSGRSSDAQFSVVSRSGSFSAEMV